MLVAGGASLIQDDWLALVTPYALEISTPAPGGSSGDFQEQNGQPIKSPAPSTRGPGVLKECFPSAVYSLKGLNLGAGPPTVHWDSYLKAPILY